MTIVHIANIQISTETGMGRIALMWKNAFLQNGHSFIHIGTNEVLAKHILLWGRNAAVYCKKKNIQADIWLVHEPYAGSFTNFSGKLVVFSHGIEERGWLINQQYNFKSLSLKAKLLPKFVRFFSQNKGFRNAELCLLSNSSDVQFLKSKGIDVKRLFIFHNGYKHIDNNEKKHLVNNSVNVLFNGTWLPRKGTQLIKKSLHKLLCANKKVHLFLIGVSVSSHEILQEFPIEVRKQVTIVEKFKMHEEIALLEKADIFLLPSYFEGQSVALTQAMALGLCPVVSDNSGQIDFVEHGKNGVVFETGNIEDLTNQLKYLIDNPQLVVKLGNQARNSVSNKSWDRVTIDIVKKLESLI